MKVLIVDDDVPTVDAIRDLVNWHSLGIDKIFTAYDYAEAQQQIRLRRPDIILCDIEMPKGSGLDLLRRLKADGNRANVIITSAKDSLDDKVTGLGLGADDYLAKPFHMAELVARMRSVARRSMNAGDFAFVFGNVSLEPDTGRVTVAGQDVLLLKKEFDILKYFIQRPEHIVDKAVLAEAVWGDHVDQADDFQFVYAQVKNLRQQLKRAGANVEIRSVYGFGYKLVVNESDSDEGGK